jgi:hypothetical protein
MISNGWILREINSREAETEICRYSQETDAIMEFGIIVGLGVIAIAGALIFEWRRQCADRNSGRRIS